MPKTDSVLHSRWSDRRDAEAFAELISRHAAMVHGTCLRLLKNVSDAEDITPRVFPKTEPETGPWQFSSGRVASSRGHEFLPRQDARGVAARDAGEGVS
jgi:hypothetical protein